MLEEFTGINTFSSWWCVSTADISLTQAPVDNLLVPTWTDLNLGPLGTSVLLDKHIHKYMLRHSWAPQICMPTHQMWHVYTHRHTRRGKLDMAIIRFIVSLILLQLSSTDSFPSPSLLNYSSFPTSVCLSHSLIPLSSPSPCSSVSFCLVLTSNWQLLLGDLRSLC